jgi:uncharacterized protein (DUF433 family)
VWIEQNPHKRPIADARIRGHGVAVWAIVAHYDATTGNADQVAAGFNPPVEAVRAALAYYKRHKKLIDARITINAA